MSSTRPLASAPVRLQIVCDLETLLVDTAAGVNLALDTIARRTRGTPAPLRLSSENLQSWPLDILLSELAGSADPQLRTELLEHYRRVYEEESRWQAPLQPGAQTLIETLTGLDADLHVVSTLEPASAIRRVQAHRLQSALTTLYTPPQRICPRFRAALFLSFMARRQHPADAYLLLSDNLAEIDAARRLGVAVLALGYGQTPAGRLETVDGLLGVAHSPLDVSHWLNAREAARLCLHHTAERPAARLH